MVWSNGNTFMLNDFNDEEGIIKRKLDDLLICDVLWRFEIAPWIYFGDTSWSEVYHLSHHICLSSLILWYYDNEKEEYKGCTIIRGMYHMPW